MEIDAMKNLKRLERTIDKALDEAKERSFKFGEVAGACKVIRMLNLNKKKSIELLCKAIGLSETSGKEYYDKYIAKK